jgi:hypothetical protein
VPDAAGVTHCWGSETSDPCPPPGLAWGVGVCVLGSWPYPRVPLVGGVPPVGGWGGVGLLFEIWIVDASIFVAIFLCLFDKL